MDPNSQPPPQGPVTPPSGYSSAPPPSGYSGAPPPSGYSGQPPSGGPPAGYSSAPPPPPRQAGGGLSQYINATVQASPVERFTIMLLRLIAWIALIILVISLCSDFFNVIMGMGNEGRGNEFRFLLNGFADLLRNFAIGAVTAATLLALASIVESLIVMRRNRT